MDIVISIPPRGRTFVAAIYKLANLGFVDSDIANDLAKIVNEDRKRITVEQREIAEGKRKSYTSREELIEMLSKKENKYALTVSSNLIRYDRPHRIEFDELDTIYNNIQIKVVGKNHYVAPQLIRAGEVDIGFVGFDEIGITFSSDKDRERTKKWPAFNALVNPRQTDLRIRGSAGLHDYTAHFIVSNKTGCNVKCIEDEYRFETEANEFYVDGKYKGLYTLCFLDKDFKPSDKIFKYSKKVEDDVKGNGMGIALVNTGRTIKDKGLFVVGFPLLQSETVIAYDLRKFEESENLRKVIEALEPLDYDSDERLKYYLNWYMTLEDNLKGRWENKPSVGEMFIDENDRKIWARGIEFLKPVIEDMYRMYRTYEGVESESKV